MPLPVSRCNFPAIPAPPALPTLPPIPAAVMAPILAALEAITEAKRLLNPSPTCPLD